MTLADIGLLVLRLGLGLTFAAHGAQKAFGWWNGPGAVGWRAAMERMGFRPVGLFAAASTGIELVGGIFMALGLLTPFVAGILVAQTVVIIAKVHWSKGFFNTAGGYEFPLSLGLAAAAIALLGPGGVIIAKVHWSKGFFNTAGGYEFPLSLGLAAAAIALLGPGGVSLDGLLGVAWAPELGLALIALGLLGGAVALQAPRMTAPQLPAPQAQAPASAAIVGRHVSEPSRPGRNTLPRNTLRRT